MDASLLQKIPLDPESVLDLEGRIGMDPDVPFDSAIKFSSLQSVIQLTSALYSEEGNPKTFAAMTFIVKEADVQMRNVFTAKDAAA
jgi:hypothetical protein